MKEGWEVKKLGDCFVSIKNGANIKQERGASGIPITRIETLSGGVFNRDRLGYANIHSTEKYLSYILDDGDLLLSHINSKTYIGRTVVYNKLNDEIIIHGMNLLRLKSIREVLSPYYAYYCFKSDLFKDQVASYRKDAVNQSSIPVSDLKKINIPLPPLPEQEKIVAELDCLSGIIEKKKQQLKELDALAQSIFYEMFGDPVENEKGWEVKKLGEVSEVTSFKRVLIEDVVECGVPFIRGTELSALSKLTNSKNFPFTLFITPEHYERVKAISGVPTVGDLLIPSINSEGLVWVLDTDEPRYYKDGRVLWVHTNHQYNESIALKYIISNKLRLMYKELASGATFIELKLFVLREMELPFPPLSLQHSFASKVEAIEKQKELIKQSIAETELLFNSRMDHYFN